MDFPTHPCYNKNSLRARPTATGERIYERVMKMKKFIQEFKEFAFRGNVVDLAVGVVIGSAFTGIVNSIVNDLFTPIIARITGSVDFSSLVIKLAEGEEAPTILLGSFLQTVINFFIVAVCIFCLVKVINRLHRPKVVEPAPAPRLCPYCKSEIADDATRCPHCTSQLS